MTMWNISHIDIYKPASFFLINAFYFTLTIYIYFAHFYIDGHLTGFYIFTFTNNDAFSLYTHMKFFLDY